MKTTSTKTCNECKIDLSLKNFTINKATADGYSNKCKKCYKETRKKHVIKPKVEKYNPNRIEKICQGECKLLKPIHSFGKSKLLKDGRENVCIDCRALKRKQNALSLKIIKTEKKCFKCQNELNINLFSKDASRDDGYSYICKNCKSKALREYYQTDLGKEKNKIRTLTWRLNNLDKTRQNSGAYYQNNKIKINKRVIKYHRSPEGRCVLIKAQAKYRGINYELNKDFVNQFWKSECYYCGDDLDIPRFDRVNSDLGYTENNVVPCCVKCNYMKNDLSVDKFYQHLRKILKYQQDQIIETGTPKIIFSGNPKNDYYLSPYGRFAWYQNQAKKRKIDFKIEYYEFIQYWQKPCHYCGGIINTIGLDRSDNNLGYVSNNIVACCEICNSMKSDYTLVSFLAQVSKIEKYLKEEK